MAQIHKEVKYINQIKHFAKELLNQIKVIEPTNEQIEIIENFIRYVICENQLLPQKHLSKREQVCLYWTARGKSSQQIAKILNLKVSTIETHRTHIKKKLNSSNMAHAVFQGLRVYNLNADYIEDFSNLK